MNDLLTNKRAMRILMVAVVCVPWLMLGPGTPRALSQSKPSDDSGRWITSIALDPNHEWIYATSATSLLLRSGTLHRSSFNNPSELESLWETPSSAWKLVLLRDPNGVVVSDYSGNLFRGPRTPGGDVKQIASGLRWSRSMVELPDQRLLVGTEDGKLIVFDLTQDAEQSRIDGHRAQVMSITTFENHVVSSSADGSVKVWTAKDLALVREVQAGTNAVWAACLCQDGQWLVSGGADRRVQLHQASTGQFIMSLAVLPDWITSLAVLPEDVVAAGCMNGRIYFFHVPSKRKFFELEGPGSAIWSLAYSVKPPRLLVGTRKHGLVEFAESAWGAALKLAIDRFASEHPPAP